MEKSGLIFLAIGLLFALLVLRRHLRKMRRFNRSESDLIKMPQGSADEPPEKDSYLHLLSGEGQRQIREDREKRHQKLIKKPKLKGF